MEGLKLRLKILKDAKQIDEDIEEKLNLIIQKLNLNEENGSMLITHLAISLNRIKNMENVDSLEEDEILDIKNNENFTNALEILNDLETNILKITIPENEKIYILMHILSLIERGIK